MSLSSGVAALATRIAVEFNAIRTALSGKAATSHVHAAADVSSGTLDVARVPTGSTGSTVALGNHTHSYQPSSADLTAIAGLGVTNDSVIQGKAGAWSKRTPAQLKADLALAPADLGAGGTKNATTFLRGDDTWAAGPTGPTGPQGPPGSAVIISTDTSPANAGTYTIAANTGTGGPATTRRVATSVAGFILGVPTSGFDGQQVVVEITPTVTFSLTVHASIALTNGITSPIAVPANKTLYLGLRMRGAGWKLMAARVES